jgi:hypothetical protein
VGRIDARKVRPCSSRNAAVVAGYLEGRHRDLGPPGREGESDGPADAAPAPGHQRHAPLQCRHDPALIVCLFGVLVRLPRLTPGSDL